MDGKTTMEITNDRLEEAIREYAAERTPERLSAVLNLLRPTKLFVPAMLQAPDRPTPCLIRNGSGEQFLAVYTSKEQIPKEPKSQALLNMPFPSCNSIVVKEELKLNGMVINPFTDNLVLKLELVQKLHEADEKASKMRQVKMTPEQFDVFMKKQIQFGILPKRLFSEGEEFMTKLCAEKETFVDQVCADVYKQPGLYHYSENDYSVMALDIAENLTLVRIDMPEKGRGPSLCCRVYITFDPQTARARYFTIELTKDKDVRMLGEVLSDGKHTEHGPAPVEGAELQKIIDLTKYDGTEMTS